MNKGVYVVELNNGSYYVGQSMNIQKRISLHKKGGGSTFVKNSGGIKNILKPIIAEMEDLNKWELKETLLRMYIHGVNNVRGFCYSQTLIYSNKLVNKIIKRIKTDIEYEILQKYEMYNNDKL